MGSPETMEFENFIKASKNNPQDHHKLQMMLLRANLLNGGKNGNYALYTVTDHSNELDYWVDMGTDEMPLEVKKDIMKRSKKVRMEKD